MLQVLRQWGSRRPIFSDRATPWALEVLLNAGYQWSSSELPSAEPGARDSGRPAQLLFAGTVQVRSCPVGWGEAGRVSPTLGGVYLRYLPAPLIRRAIRRLPAEVVPWTYLHPYDLDTDEPFSVLPHAGWLTSRILHGRRVGTLQRVEALAAACGGFGAPLGEIAGQYDTGSLETITL